MSIKLNAALIRASLFCGLCGTISCPAIAAPLQNPRPTRPQFPASFDHATVQRLLDDIDQPQNASILKTGYFLRRGQPELPVGEGYELLTATLTAEKVGTDKWFLLQNLRAFVAFRVPDVDSDEGFTAYDAIFDEAKIATSPRAQYALRQAISEFVGSVSGKLGGIGLRTDERTREMLLKAWAAYATALGTGKMAPGARTAEPNWQAAIKAAEAEAEFVPAVEKLLDDKTVPPNFNLLLAAASLIAPKNPGRALAVLQRAKPLLPTQNGAPDVNATARWYAQFVDLLVARDRLPEAIKSQQEFVALTSFGQAKLVTLYRKSGDETSLKQLLTALAQPDAGEQQIGDVAEALFAAARGDEAAPGGKVAPDDKAGAQGETLLKAYLAANRKREVVAEMQARLALGGYYLRHQRENEALDVLNFTLPESTLQPTERGRAGGQVSGLVREIAAMKQRAQVQLDAGKAETR